MVFQKPREIAPGNKSDWENLRKIDKNLLEAFDLKDFKNVDKLIQSGANVNVHFGQIKDTALHFFDDVDIVMKLVNCGANVLSSNRYYESPLIYACKFGRHKDIINCLLSNGAYVNKRIKLGGKKIIPLTFALENMGERIDLEVIENLLYYGANLDFGRMFTHTPFITALRQSPEIARIMIKYSVLKIWDKYRYLRMGYVERKQLVSINNISYLSYLDECIAEVSLLKEEMYNSWHSFYDICRASICYNYCTEPNRSFVDMKNDDSLKSKYPIYIDVLFKRIDFMRHKRSKLLQNLDNVQISAKIRKKKNCKRLVNLNRDCVRHIAKCLSNYDIERVICAASPRKC